MAETDLVSVKVTKADRERINDKRGAQHEVVADALDSLESERDELADVKERLAELENGQKEQPPGKWVCPGCGDSTQVEASSEPWNCVVCGARMQREECQ